MGNVLEKTYIHTVIIDETVNISVRTQFPRKEIS